MRSFARPGAANAVPVATSYPAKEESPRASSQALRQTPFQYLRTSHAVLMAPGDGCGLVTRLALWRSRPM